MAYTPTTWVTGDTITAEKLNNMESGIAAGGSLIVKIVPASDQINNKLDKTWAEIHAAVLSTGVTIIRREISGNDDYITIAQLQNVDYEQGTGYYVVVSDTEYFTSTADSYPQTNLEG